MSTRTGLGGMGRKPVGRKNWGIWQQIREGKYIGLRRKGSVEVGWQGRLLSASHITHKHSLRSLPKSLVPHWGLLSESCCLAHPILLAGFLTSGVGPTLISGPTP